MIIAKQDGFSLIVGTADNFAEMEAMYASATATTDRLFSGEFQPSVTDMLLDERFSSLRKPPYVFDFPNVDKLTLFTKQFSVRIVPARELDDRQRDMLDAIADDLDDNRTIGEIYGLDQNDPWDHRTEEQKQQDAEYKRDADKAKAAGKLSGDSFGSKKKDVSGDKHNIAVTDIHTSVNEDGSVTIDDILAVKGLYDDNGKGAWLPLDKVVDAQPGEEFYQFTFATEQADANVYRYLETLGEASQEVVYKTANTFALRVQKIANRMHFYLNTKQIDHTIQIVDGAMTVLRDFEPNEALALEIDPSGQIAIYYRLEVTGIDLETVLLKIDDASTVAQKDLLSSIVAARGAMDGYCWFACATNSGAETLQKIVNEYAATLLDGSYEVEVYGVNDVNERLVPKGVQIVQELDLSANPRPWNDRAPEWEAMSPEDRKNTIPILGEEFIFCGNYRGASDGCVLYITPRAYFREHGELWSKPVNMITLPLDLKQIEPGIFQTKSRSDWAVLCTELCQKGMIESLVLQLHINSLD